MAVSRGALVVVEGVDRSGKTTFSKNIVSELIAKGIEVEYINFPKRSTEIGKAIDRYLSKKDDFLNDQTIHLLFSANRWEYVAEMKKKLNSGITLIVDRYSYSGIAYSAAKGLNFEWCKAPEIGLPNPDRVYFLHLDSNLQAMRNGFGDERYDDSSFQEKVFAQYMKQQDFNWKMLNASRSPSELIDEELVSVQSLIEDVKHKELLKIC